ncbi:ABC transporter permease [Chloroflexota bacterium]
MIGLSVAVASGSLFFATIILRGVQSSLAVGKARLGADLVVVPSGQEIAAQEAFITGSATSFTMKAEIEELVANVEGVELTSAQLYIQTLSNAKCCIGEFFLVGFEPDSDFTISPWLATNIHGVELGDFDLIAGDRILLREGDNVTFFGTAFNVIGVLEKTGMGIDRTIYVPMAGVRAMIADSEEKAEKALEIAPDEISAVLVKVEAGQDVLDVAERIEAEVSDVNVFTASHLNQAVGNQMRGVVGIVVSVTIVLWIMSLFMVGLVFSLIVNERQRELGLLRAMGAKQGLVFRLVISEAAVLTGLGGIAGLLFSGVILIAFSKLIQVRLGIPYLTPSILEIIGIEAGMILLSLLIGLLASLQPAYSSSRMEPYAAIRQGE